MTRKTRIYMGAASALAVAVSLACAGGAYAQVTTSTLRGSVTENAAGEAGATIVARNVGSGFTTRTTANANGGYVLSGLRPGTYEVTATTTDGQTVTDTVTIGVGQVGDLDLAVGGGETAAPDGATDVGDVVVVGRRLVEVRTPENATNVTTQQINTLPQISRNFLGFAALAPGVRLNSSENEVTISAGGQRAESVNAFIDGASQKSNVISGGIAGQDDSKGNPFPQAGIQEFRVVSQNFKAEYEQASSAIITAVTRSGTNEFHGEIFGSYRNQDWISTRERSYITDGRPWLERELSGTNPVQVVPDLEVRQYGFALGGPIIQDRLHFFGTYERKEEGRATEVNITRANDGGLRSQFADLLGVYSIPFEEDLYFGKLSWQPAEGHLVDLSVTYRTESDITAFGGVNTFERAQDQQQETKGANLRYQWRGDGFTNEFAIDYRRYNYNPTALNFDDYGRSYRAFNNGVFNAFGGDVILNVGGSGTRQDIVDEALTFRDDLTFNDIEWSGFHTIKMGIKCSRQNYYVDKEFGRNPQFFYDIDGIGSGSASVPYRVELGGQFPVVDLDNEVFGLYIQDDWQITDKLELNLGIRWDYETNANNESYVTPQSIVDGVRQWVASTDGGKPAGYAPSWFNLDDYVSTGDNREAFKGAFQPRIGFSYDFFGDRSTVLFGGAGRYYDRVNFNFSFDEIAKPYQVTRNAFFSTTGSPTGAGTPEDRILWNNSYLTAAALDPLLARIPAKAEAFLLNNDIEPPRTDQFNLGVRQRLGDWQTEWTVAYGKTENEFTWQYLTRCREPSYGNDGGGFGDNGGFCGPGGANPYRGYFVSDHNKVREFTALYVKLDKNYTEDSGWGLHVAYTLASSEQNGGNDNFCFDCFSIDTSPVRSTSTDERHRIVANGTYDLPLGLQLSGILTLGTGTPFDVNDNTGSRFYFRPMGGRPEDQGDGDIVLLDNFVYRNLDLRLTKNFELWNGSELSVFIDALNITNARNYSGWDGNTGSATNPNYRYGRPSTFLYPSRTFQLGVRYSF